MDRWKKLVGIGTIGLALTIGTGISLAHPHDGPPPGRRDDRPDQRGDRRHERQPEHRRGEHRRDEKREGRRGGPMIQMRQLLRGLELDESQRDAIREIVRKSRDEARKIHEESTDPAQRRDDLRALAGRVQGEVESKLNEQQKEKFGSRVDRLKDKARFPMIHRLDRVLDRMNLNDDQRAQVNELLADLRKRVEETRSKAEGEDRQSSREELRNLVRDTHEKLKEILTPEQRDRLRRQMRPQQENRDHDRRMDRHEPRREDRPARRPHRPIRPV